MAACACSRATWWCWRAAWCCTGAWGFVPLPISPPSSQCLLERLCPSSLEPCDMMSVAIISRFVRGAEHAPRQTARSPCLALPQAEEARALSGRMHELATTRVSQHEGHMSGRLADGFTVLFNWPRVIQGAEERACACACAILEVRAACRPAPSPHASCRRVPVGASPRAERHARARCAGGRAPLPRPVWRARCAGAQRARRPALRGVPGGDRGRRRRRAGARK